MNSVVDLVERTDIRIYVVDFYSHESNRFLLTDLTDVRVFMKDDGFDLWTLIWLENESVELYPGLELTVQLHCKVNYIRYQY